MDPATIALFLAACFMGAVIQSITGFGFGIFVMTIFPFFMPSYVTSVTVSMILSLSMCVYMACISRKNADFKLILLPLISYAVTNTICVSLSLTQSDTSLKKMLGVFLFVLSLYFVFFSQKITIKPTKINGIFAGLLSGALSGMFGAGGPPIVIYLMSVSGTPEKYLANIQCFFAVSSFYNLAMRIMNKMVTQTVLSYWAIGIPVVFAGVYVGRKFLTKMNANTVKRLVYIFMALSGAIMFYSA